jgi:RNA polymerase subunit RPABC4/transcription elongation factor Spt4
MVKCIKCVIEIPDSASYCPNCGSPKPEEQKVSQPMYRSIKTSNLSTSPLGGIFNIIFSKTAIILVITLGFLFSWVGIVIMIFASDSTDIARLLISIGFTGMGFFLVNGGIWNSRIEKFVRLAMVLMGIFLVIQSLSVIGFYSWMI